MDAPLVLTTRLNPSEIDKEALNVDCSWQYPRAFYEASQGQPHPAELKSHIEIDAHAHDGAEELMAVYDEGEIKNILRGKVDLSDAKLPNAVRHYFEVLPAGDPTLNKFKSKLYSYIQHFSGK